ncbi:serine hydrolase [Streptomyces sp. LaPpAH-108]|uniref:serine hydrolase n=1 Tax=Streptomyces sp. LaPpAH-108 TaxID=1155714 RepID=UPI0003646332|nr:serine hydrolase [Streptomyces sp. LaPpAH-108]
MPHPFTHLSRSRRTRRATVTGALAALTAALVTAGTLPAAAAPRHGSDFAKAVHAQGKARVAAAVLDLDDPKHRPEVHGDGGPFDTASIVKVDILAAALMKAHGAGRNLSAVERDRAKAMIEHSDNAAANALWRSIGLAPGLKAANKRLGLTETEGGSGPRWGLTRTTPRDQIRLLRAVFDPGPATPLDQTSRAYIRSLMGNVADEQSWGVSAAGAHGALKNGWLQRNTTGLWDVNSVGRITKGGHRYLVAVLSDGNTSMQDGIALVERAARAAVAG